MGDAQRPPTLNGWGQASPGITPPQGDYPPCNSILTSISATYKLKRERSLMYVTTLATQSREPPRNPSTSIPGSFPPGFSRHVTKQRGTCPTGGGEVVGLSIELEFCCGQLRDLRLSVPFPELPPRAGEQELATGTQNWAQKPTLPHPPATWQTGTPLDAAQGSPSG